MPVTHAHPAAVLPLIAYGGRRFDAPALVIGSLVPDFPSFLALDLERKETHSLIGLLLYCVPVGLLAYALYRLLLRPGFLALLGHNLSEEEPLPSGWKERGEMLLRVSLSLWIGAATHIFWDGLTHYSGWAAPCFAALLGSSGISFSFFRCLQELSGVFGILTLGWYGFRKLRQNAALPWESREWKTQLRRRCLSYLVIALIAGSFASMAALDLGKKKPNLDLQLRYLIVYTTDALLLLLLTQGALVRFAPARERRPGYLIPASRK